MWKIWTVLGLTATSIATVAGAVIYGMRNSKEAGKDQALATQYKQDAKDNEKVAQINHEIANINLKAPSNNQELIDTLESGNEV